MYDRMIELFNYYVAHQTEFVEKYNGKSILLVDFNIAGVFDNDWEAAQNALEKYPPGSFIVQRVAPGVEAYTASIASIYTIVGA